MRPLAAWDPKTAAGNTDVTGRLKARSKLYRLRCCCARCKRNVCWTSERSATCRAVYPRASFRSIQHTHQPQWATSSAKTPTRPSTLPSVRLRRLSTREQSRQVQTPSAASWQSATSQHAANTSARQAGCSSCSCKSHVLLIDAAGHLPPACRPSRLSRTLARP